MKQLFCVINTYSLSACLFLSKGNSTASHAWLPGMATSLTSTLAYLSSLTRYFISGTAEHVLNWGGGGGGEEGWTKPCEQLQARGVWGHVSLKNLWILAYLKTLTLKCHLCDCCPWSHSNVYCLPIWLHCVIHCLALFLLQWSPLLLLLKDRICQSTGASLNSMLANLYRDNKDSVVSSVFSFTKNDGPFSFFLRIPLVKMAQYSGKHHCSVQKAE